MTDKISLIGMVFYGYHGDLPEERKLGQRFIVDVELFGDYSEAAKTDLLDKAVDYVKVFEEVRKILEGKPCNLIEAVADRVCNVVLSKFSGVQKITVRIKKPSVSLPGSLDAAMVEFTRLRP